MNWVERNLGGHISLGPITVYGSNAMHFAINIRTKRWGFICFRPPVYDMGRWWGWYVYISRDGTPCKPACTYARGPGLRD